DGEVTPPVAEAGGGGARVGGGPGESVGGEHDGRGVGEVWAGQGPATFGSGGLEPHREPPLTYPPLRRILWSMETTTWDLTSLRVVAMRAEALAWLAGRLDWEDRLLDLEAGSGEPSAGKRIQSLHADRPAGAR